MPRRWVVAARLLAAPRPDAAGGVRDLDSVKAMVAAGATRIGASAGVRIVQESRSGTATAPAKGY